MSSASTDYKLIKTRTEGGVGVLELHRPKAPECALQRLCFSEINDALAHFDNDNAIGAVVITRQWPLVPLLPAPDIKEMKDNDFISS